jgi:PAS domain S-box-containing protein
MNPKYPALPAEAPQAPLAHSALAPADLLAVFAALPGVWLLLAADAPRFTMLAASDERLAATMTTREGTLGRPLFEVFPDANPDNLDASGVGNLRASLETVVRTRAPHRMPVQRYDLRRADGTWEERYWSPLNAPVPGPDGEVRFLLHQVRDVTDEVVGHEALARAQRRAARVLEQMMDAHFVLDREFRFVALNPAAERMVGQPREALLGRTHWEAFPASVHMDLADAYRRVVAEGKQQHLQQHYVGDGLDLHLEIDAYPTEEGGAAIFARDITDRVQALQARRKSDVQRFLAQLGDALRSLGDAQATRPKQRGFWASSWAPAASCMARPRTTATRRALSTMTIAARRCRPLSGHIASPATGRTWRKGCAPGRPWWWRTCASRRGMRARTSPSARPPASAPVSSCRS